MNGLDIDRLVGELGHDCLTCRRHASILGQFWQDLRHIIRKANRNPRYVPEVAVAKAALASARTEALRHVEDEHGTQARPTPTISQEET